MIKVRTFISLWILDQKDSIEDFDTFFLDHLQYNLEHEVNDLNPADEREACEEPHGASYSRQLVHKLGCSVLERRQEEFEEENLYYHLRDPVKGRGDDWDLDVL